MVGEGEHVMADIPSSIEGTSRNVGWRKGLQFGVWELVQEYNSPLVCHIHHHEFKTAVLLSQAPIPGRYNTSLSAFTILRCRHVRFYLGEPNAEPH